MLKLEQIVFYVIQTVKLNSARPKDLENVNRENAKLNSELMQTTFAKVVLQIANYAIQTVLTNAIKVSVKAIFIWLQLVIYVKLVQLIVSLAQSVRNVINVTQVILKTVVIHVLLATVLINAHAHQVHH